MGCSVFFRYINYSSSKALFSHQGQHGDNPVEDFFNLVYGDSLLEAGVADTDNFVEVILNPFWRPLFGYFGTKFFEVAAQLFRL